MKVEVNIKESHEPNAKVLGFVTWLSPPSGIHNHTLSAGYMYNSVTGEEKLLEYAYVPDAVYKRNM